MINKKPIAWSQSLIQMEYKNKFHNSKTNNISQHDKNKKTNNKKNKIKTFKKIKEEI